ncbi:ribosome silencing factor [Neoactinobaculum massilliense]|uniref:ribosome silencing factor n=1 Tax=Neoactinobaculum massilliense TaxID=2364794 RepID=UPI000F52029B|nr:ribosome silencing factor [Neoactinobaculum massilliense]
MEASIRAQKLAQAAAEAGADVKATSIVALDVSERFAISDVFVVISGSTERQVRAIVREVDERVRAAGGKELRREGLDADPRWVVMDFGEIIVHVQRDEDHNEYALAKLWGDCPRLALVLPGYDADGEALDAPEPEPAPAWYQCFAMN